MLGAVVITPNVYDQMSGSKAVSNFDFRLPHRVLGFDGTGVGDVLNPRPVVYETGVRRRDIGRKGFEISRSFHQDGRNVKMHPAGFARISD